MKAKRERCGTTGSGRSRALGLVSAWLLASACDSSTPEPAASPETQAQAEVAEGKPAPAPVSPSLLEGVIPQGIEPPPDGGSTFRVDAYVAALVAEQLRRSPAPFSAWRSDGAAPGRPSVGYRVGPLPPGSPFARLGLHEGDIIEAVNDVSTGEPGWAEQALQRADNRVTVTVFRDDASSTLDYRLVDGLAWQTLTQPSEASDDGLAAADVPEDDDAAGRGIGGGGGGGGGVGAGGGAGVGAGPGADPSVAKPRPSSPSRPSSGGGGGGGTKTPSSTPSTTPSKPSAGARCTSDDRCTIDQATFDRMIASPSKLQAQADVVPAIRDDVFSGYKLRTVKSGTTVAQLGFRSGDKITHVNGRDLTNDAQAMQLYLGLSSTRVYKVRYVRGGATRNKTITVQ